MKMNCKWSEINLGTLLQIMKIIWNIEWQEHENNIRKYGS